MDDRFLFRVWNPVAKEWVYRNFFDGIHMDNFSPVEDTVCPLGQFSGYHDVNENKIFEGDIVGALIIMPFERIECVYIVTWMDGGFYLSNPNEVWEPPIDECAKIIILGNIVENKIEDFL